MNNFNKINGEREKRKWGGDKFRFAAAKVPRQCPLVLLVEVGFVKLSRLEVGKEG
jgi:hypothetical protein